MRLFAPLALLFALAAPAQAATYVDIFGGTGTSTVTDTNMVRGNVYDIDYDCTLTNFEVWYYTSQTMARNRQVTFGVWEKNPSTTTWTNIWQTTTSVYATGYYNHQWDGPPASSVNVPLQGGTTYLIGVWSDRQQHYGFSSSNSTMGSALWGDATGYYYFDDIYSFPTYLYSSINNQNTGGYGQRLTIDLVFDDDGDGSNSDFDCDDNDASVYPGAPEGCNGIDNDCDGLVAADEADVDGDGWMICESDCDDNDATSNPGAFELCDGTDNDCNGSIDDGLTFDLDGDGYTEVGSCEGTGDDCDDADAGVNVGASETCDGVDEDCDGTIDEGLTDDVDGDGYTSIGSCLGSADDCDDTNAFTNPGGVEICDGADNTCDGTLAGNETDDDGDGVLACDGDCDDTNAAAYPGAPEGVCDEEDLNCDGSFSYSPQDCGDDDDSVGDDDDSVGDDDDSTGDDDDSVGDDDDSVGDDDDSVGDDDDSVGDDDDSVGDDDDDDGGNGGGGSRSGGCRSSMGAEGGSAWGFLLLGLGVLIRRRR